MWLFTRYGFFSIACASQADGAVDPQTVMVRARRKAHLQKLQSRFQLIAPAEIVTLPERDYRYRLIVPKAAWVAVSAELAEEQDWSNFKDEAARFQGTSGADYICALHAVWDVMYSIQKSERWGAPTVREK
jgi:hypothetical protein